MTSTVLLVGLCIALLGPLVQTQSQRGVLQRRRENDIIDIDSPFEGSGGFGKELGSGAVSPDAEDDDDDLDEEEEEDDEDDLVDVDAEDDGGDDVTKAAIVPKREPGLGGAGVDNEDVFEGSGVLLPGSASASTSTPAASSTSVTSRSTSVASSTRTTPLASSTKTTTVASTTKTTTAASTTKTTTAASTTKTTTITSSTKGSTLPIAVLSRCLRLREEGGGSRPVIGEFRPQCTPEGDFAALQCHHSTGYCWCVDPREGEEIRGTKARGGPSRVDCSGSVSKASAAAVTVSTSSAPTARRQPATTRQRASTTSADDIILVDYTTQYDVKASEVTRDRSTVFDPFIETDPDLDGVDHSNAVELKHRTFLSTFRDPLILAGIIGGAVLALLCIVLLVMFTIYRMRKKDEGSYALDAPKRTSDVKYERAKQEYFA